MPWKYFFISSTKDQSLKSNVDNATKKNYHSQNVEIKIFSSILKYFIWRKPPWVNSNHPISETPGCVKELLTQTIPLRINIKVCSSIQLSSNCTHWLCLLDWPYKPCIKSWASGVCTGFHKMFFFPELENRTIAKRLKIVELGFSFISAGCVSRQSFANMLAIKTLCSLLWICWRVSLLVKSNLMQF